MYKLSSRVVEIGFVDPIGKSLAKVEIRQMCRTCDLVECLYASVILENNCWDINPPGCSDGWTYEHPNPDLGVGRVILFI